MTNILYLSYDGMTDQLGQSQVIPYLAGLSREGYHFHLVSFEKKEHFEKERDYISALLKGYGISWHPLSYTKKPPVISTMYDLYRMKRKGKELITKHNIRIIHCRSYISGLAGLHLSRVTGAKFIFDMRGFYANERVDGGLWNLSNPVYKAIFNFFKKKESDMLRAADAVISLTDLGKIEMDSWNLRTPVQLPIQVIPCCADLNHFNREKVSQQALQQLKSKLGLVHAHPVISYLGSVGTWYMLDEMLAFFKTFRLKYPEAVFLFITRDDPATIVKRAALKGIPETALRFYGASRNEVPTALSLCDISLFFIKPVYSKKASSPTKQAEIMGMGIPLICNKGVGDTDTVVVKYGSGISIDLQEPGALQHAVDQYENLVNIPSSKIIKGAHDFFSLESGVKKYLSVYKKVTGGKMILMPGPRSPRP